MKKIILLNIFLVWLITFLNYCPAIILWPIVSELLNYNTTVGIDNYECRADFRNNFYYLLIANSIEFFIPFLSITVFNCSISIYWNIRQRIIKSRLVYFKIPDTLIYNNLKKEKQNKIEMNKSMFMSLQTKYRSRLKFEPKVGLK